MKQKGNHKQNKAIVWIQIFTKIHIKSIYIERDYLPYNAVAVAML